MNKEEAIKFVQEERTKEITEFTEKLESLIKDYDIILDVEVMVSPSGVSKRIIIVDNKKLI